MAGGRRKKQRFSRIHAFPCGRASFRSEHSLIGGPGFSRIVYCNEPECFEAGLQNYASNYVRTTKYTLATFLPKSLFEQFRRVANFYFLLCAILSFTPLSPYSAISNVVPLVVVIGATMGKEVIEDWRRKKQVCFMLPLTSSKFNTPCWSLFSLLWCAAFKFMLRGKLDQDLVAWFTKGC